MVDSAIRKIRVGIIYPSDPLGSIPGGIETFIRGIIGWAPDDLEFTVIGITTDPGSRPVGKWTECHLRHNTFSFLPLYAMEDPGKRPKIPATVQYTALLFKEVRKHSFDVLDSHRIEPFLPYLFGRTPKNVFLHQNMEVIRTDNSDIRWKHLPWVYEKFEDVVLRRVNSIYVVREDAVRVYRERYPLMRDSFNFVPTWVDPEMFYPATEDSILSLRVELQESFGIHESDSLMITVGRLDTQKDPVLLIESFNRVFQKNNNVHLLIIGEGRLRSDIEKKIASLGLQDKVSLAGLVDPKDIARYLQASDMFVLSSAYEGMPMCVLEAMGCGLPVATTDVGEVRRVIKPGINGEIAADRKAEGLANAIEVVLANIAKYRGEPCLDAALQYVPEKVLGPIYENYRRLAAG